MYSGTITLFNHYKSRLGDMWYPTVIHGVNIQIDKAAIMAKYGAESKDNAILNVKYEHVVINDPTEGELLFRAFIKCQRVINGEKVFVGKEWFPPKEWGNQTNDKLPETITFSSGKGFDFFMLGEYENLNPIPDNDVLWPNGFYDYMNAEYDFVFAITSVAQYSVIPHFEIMGA